MPLVINTNVSSLNAQRQMVDSGKDLSTAMERLSSGKRINSAADDAAGLAIANRMTSQVRGLNQAVRNANDGISMIQTAEGALDEATNILQRMRELSIQAANGIYSGEDKDTLDAEVQELKSELTRIAENTTFNGQPLLDGTITSVDLQIGSEANQTITINIGNLADIFVQTNTDADAVDVDGSGVLDTTDDTDATQVDISATGDPQRTIQVVDMALEKLNATRADLGAAANRMEFSINNLMNVSENTAAARSRIMDADFAAETANLSRAQVLQQASQAMLAQANAQPQQVLQLLQG